MTGKIEIQIQRQLFIRTNQITRDRESIWFLHGFADSGLVYKEVFQSQLCDEFDIYVIDFPGFGVSPMNAEFVSMKQQANLLSQIIQKETSNKHHVNIVAHSLGALIGTWVCQSLKERINYYFSIEGNLTLADSYFSSKPLEFGSTTAFVESFHKEIFELAKSEERYQRYYSSLRFAEPEAMENWCLTSQEYVRDNRCGFEFKALTCNKVYIWGDVDTPVETQKFIKQKRIPNQLYQGIGHWHMVENSAQLFGDILSNINFGKTKY